MLMNISRTIVAVGAALLLACSGRSAAPTSSSSGGPQPVPECQAYQREMSQCTGVNADISNQPAALASTDGDRARLATMCSANLERLRQSCR